jgi:flagellar motor switch protein FliM
VSTGEFDSQYDDHNDTDFIFPYDFTSQGRNAHERMPALKMINDRFASLFAENITQLLNSEVTLSIIDVQRVKLAEYIPGLLVPASFNRIRIQPLAGSALCVFDPKLVFYVVDSYFGGSGKSFSKPENRKFAPMEMRMIQILLEKCMQDLKQAWQPVLAVDVEYVNSDVNTNLTDAADLSELVVVSSFRVQMDGGSGEIHIIMPYAMLEPIRDLLNTGTGWELMGINEQFSSALQQELKDAKVEISTVFNATALSLKELSKLKVGDIIPMEAPDQVQVRVGDTPLFIGQFGMSNGKNAVTIQSKCKHDRSMSVSHEQ